MSKMMKTIKPQRMWIDGNCFTIMGTKRGQTDSLQDNMAEKYNIKKHEDGQYMTSFRLPSMYYSKLFNPQCFMLDDFQKDTNTLVELPQSFVGGNITVKGDTITEIVDARNELHLLASEIRDHGAALQFLSIPVCSDEIKENFKKFKEDVLSLQGINGMHESIFQSADKLHLTIAVLSLHDDHEKAEAVNVLNDCKEDVLKCALKDVGPLKLRVEGVECMNDNVSKANILYAVPKFCNEDGPVTLQDVANRIQDHFYNRGLVVKHTDNVKLHVTLLNTKYRKVTTTNSPSPKKNKWHFKKQPFNATEILEKYKDYKFGETDFKAVHFSLIKSVGDDGFYKSIASIHL